MSKYAETSGKYRDLIWSPRFHQILAVFAIQVLAHYFLADDYVFDALSVMIGAVAGVGTIDKAAEKLGMGNSVSSPK